MHGSRVSTYVPAASHVASANAPFGRFYVMNCHVKRQFLLRLHQPWVSDDVCVDAVVLLLYILLYCLLYPECLGKRLYYYYTTSLNVRSS